jgi:hypothetical protein
MLHAIQRAIEPPQSLESILSDWGRISMALRERVRARRSQINIYTFLT